jgi:hypothetical protein
MENTATLKATQEIKFVMVCHDMFLEYTLLFSINEDLWAAVGEEGSDRLYFACTCCT